MGFAKLPTQAPQFDATALQTFLNNVATKTGLKAPSGLVPWKRWTEATSEYDGSGLRDVVNANALGLNALKADVDVNYGTMMNLSERVDALEVAPSVPFPESGQLTAGP